jgi:HPt (histidine-containing phosphotransfer) domain-containing protein
VPQRLHELLAASDHTALYGLAHSLKGEAGTLGIDVIAVAADELCQSIKGGRVETYSVRTEALVQACEIVQGQMKALADP